jgi:hypothetical protein
MMARFVASTSANWSAWVTPRLLWLEKMRA